MAWACGWACVAVSIPVALVASAQPLPPMCSGLDRSDGHGHFVARPDLLRPDASAGDALLTLVNRSPAGALPPDYAPDDLVDLDTGRPSRWYRCTPPRKQCMRRQAAAAYRAMAAAMRADGLRPIATSAFRAYRVQCSTFERWASRGGFCDATTVSALPGHSQHQLGTTVDLFTREWTDGGDKFRPGYGCSPGGRWLATHAHEHGFVLPYPLHPDYRRGEGCGAVEGGEERIDPRTGYRYEPWHLRYIGRAHAERFRARWEASGPGTPGEITLEQWLRERSGASDAVSAPVCDGCNCDRCATFADPGEGPCAQPALSLDPSGAPRAPAGPPRLRDARLVRDGGGLWLEATVDVPPNTLTQPPIVTPASGARFRRGRREAQLSDRAARAFPPIAGAWRLAIGFGDARHGWPWKAALVAPARPGNDNGAQARIPAAPGELSLRVSLEGVSPGTLMRVGLAEEEEVRDVRRLTAP
ncbi:MAG: hypothetical protein SangKO_000950 [Sandaracinaceae bacterium]